LQVSAGYGGVDLPVGRPHWGRFFFARREYCTVQPVPQLTQVNAPSGGADRGFGRFSALPAERRQRKGLDGENAEARCNVLAAVAPLRRAAVRRGPGITERWSYPQAEV